MDFGKLIPRDRVLLEDDERLEMVIRNGPNILHSCTRKGFYTFIC